jgi:predicted DNA binding CopG/RHH family protein
MNAATATPRKAPGRTQKANRDEFASIRLTAEEKKRLTTRAADHGVSYSRFLRGILTAALS